MRHGKASVSLRDSATAADLADPDAKIQGFERALLAVHNGLHIARLPPRRATTLEQGMGVSTRRLVFFRIRQVFVLPKNDDGFPFLRRRQLVHSATDPGNGAHPLDLLTL